MSAEYGDLLLHTEIRWLSRGPLRFLSLLGEIQEFKQPKGEDVSLLEDTEWTLDLAFLTDITGKLNDLNCKLQGKDLLGAVNAEVNILTQREGQSVTLHTGLTGLHVDDKIFWFFGPDIPNTSIVESQVIRGEIITEFKGRFPDRLQLDRETGSLTIRNLTLNNSGVYQLDIFNTHKTSQRFYLTVYAPGPRTQVRKIPQGDVLDSSSEKGSCSVVCSVENQIDRTLSWYRGEKRLNQTSSPDLSTNLSLPLEIKLQDKDIYSCVAANPVSNQTTKLNIETLCLQVVESGPNRITIITIVLVIEALFFGICCIWKKKDIKECCVSTSGSPEEEDSVV
ncbi:hepatocyte cell adhesion molecule-like [Salmo trutta]|uniref:hepatocyte cell adhesion molecule-like n=1 Tax=Salmo trutta TaxID=8032 RepID=UPI0011303394|nr:hepatocyte cell adhesion molecule-like [Salmo trutta]